MFHGVQSGQVISVPTLMAKVASEIANLEIETRVPFELGLLDGLDVGLVPPPDAPEAQEDRIIKTKQ